MRTTGTTDTKSFGAAVAAARRRGRIGMEQFLASDDSLLSLTTEQWNEIEHNRSDPRELDPGVLRAVTRRLGIPQDEVHRLCERFDTSFAEQERRWASVVDEIQRHRARTGK